MHFQDRIEVMGQVCYTFLINKMSWLFLCKKEEQKLFITFLARIVRGVSSRTIGLILDKYINIARGTKSSFRPM